MSKIFYNENEVEFENVEKILNKGGIIIYPTDTVYGVGATIKSLEGINKIYEIKERSYDSPLIALLSKVEYVTKIAEIDEKQKELLSKLSEAFWPGALTIILKKKEIVPNIMVSNGATVGVRIPKLKLAQNIIDSVGGILPTTSANISGKISPKNYDELDEEFKKKADIVINSKKPILGIESTIIDLTDVQPKILREGAILKNEIEKIIGKL